MSKSWQVSNDGTTAKIDGYKYKDGKPVNNNVSMDYKNSIIYGENAGRRYSQYDKTTSDKPPLFEVKYLPGENINKDDLKGNGEKSKNLKGALFGHEYALDDYGKKSYKSLDKINSDIFNVTGTNQLCADALDLDDNKVIDLGEQAAGTIAKNILSNQNGEIDGKYTSEGDHNSVNLLRKDHIKENKAYLQKIHTQYGLDEAMEKFVEEKKLEAPPKGKEIPVDKDIKAARGITEKAEQTLNTMNETQEILEKMCKDMAEGKEIGSEDVEKLDELTKAAEMMEKNLKEMGIDIEDQIVATNEEIGATSEIKELLSMAYPEGQVSSQEEYEKLLALNERSLNGDDSARAEMKQILTQKGAEQQAPQQAQGTPQAQATPQASRNQNMTNPVAKNSDLKMKDGLVKLSEGKTLGDIVLANKDELSKIYGTTQLWGEDGLVDQVAKNNGFKDGINDKGLNNLKAGTGFKLKSNWLNDEMC